MDRNQATYEAFDGVEIRLLDGHVVRTASLTVEEAVRYLRLQSNADFDVAAAHEFLRDFPARMGVTETPLSAFGLVVEDVADGHRCAALTVAQGLELLELLGKAQQETGYQEQADFLEQFPKLTGLLGDDVWETFRLGHAFAEAYYLAIFGFARDFLSHLRSSPRAEVMVMRRGSSSTKGSTT